MIYYQYIVYNTKEENMFYQILFRSQECLGGFSGFPELKNRILDKMVWVAQHQIQHRARRAAATSGKL